MDSQTKKFQRKASSRYHNAQTAVYCNGQWHISSYQTQINFLPGFSPPGPPALARLQPARAPGYSRLQPARVQPALARPGPRLQPALARPGPRLQPALARPGPHFTPALPRFQPRNLWPLFQLIRLQKISDNKPKFKVSGKRKKQ